MRHKVFYRFNASTQQYERVYPSQRERLLMVLRRACMYGAIAAGVLTVLYLFTELPREKRLREENRLLRQQIDLLDHRTDQAISVMEDLAERDNNFYRVMMQAEPITPAQRYAGLERQRIYEGIDSLEDKEIVANVAAKIDRLDRMVYTQIRSFNSLEEQLAGDRDRIAHIPAIQPVPERFLRTMASGYGYRRDPIYGTTKFHEGMDFSAPVGTPVYATADGQVSKAAWQGAYGNAIDISHGYNYMTRYAHLSRMTVHQGQTVHRGDLIGYVGNTGKSTGPHLHYEVRYRGQPQNPVNYYFYDLTPEQYEELISLAENAGHVMD